MTRFDSTEKGRPSTPGRAVPATLLGLALAVAPFAAGQGTAQPAPVEAAMP